MSPSNLQFQPQPSATIAAVVLISLFIGLGFWQLERADQKRHLTELLGTRSNLPPLQLTADADTTGLEYRKLRVSGIFLAAKSVFIENRKHLGRDGFHVITPLRVEGGSRYLLVNRGWVAAGRSRSLPDVETPDLPVEVTGQATIPSPPALILGAADAFQENNPRWPYLTLERYARWSGLDILPYVLQQEEGDTQGFVRSWPQHRPEPGMHVGYAIQWFAFALIVALIWLRLSLVNRTDNGNEEHDNR